MWISQVRYQQLSQRSRDDHVLKMGGNMTQVKVSLGLAIAFEGVIGDSAPGEATARRRLGLSHGR
jgi:hypothetical protein